MSDDRDQTTARTDDDLTLQRQERFGHLPDRVRPEDVVETADTDSAHDEPEQPMVRREWG